MSTLLLTKQLEDKLHDIFSVSSKNEATKKLLLELKGKGIYSLNDYAQLIMKGINSINSKYSLKEVRFVDNPISFLDKQSLNSGMIVGEDELPIAYIFLSSPSLNSRNIFGAEQLFPGLSNLIMHFINSYSCELANLPIYFINGSADKVTKSMEATVTAIKLMGVRYLQLFNNEMVTNDKVKRNLLDYSKIIENEEVNQKSGFIQTDYYELDNVDKKITFKSIKLRKQNMKSFGSSDRFFAVRAYPALILADEGGFDIDLKEIEQFTAEFKNGKNTFETFLSFAKKLIRRRKNGGRLGTQLVYYGAPGTGKSYAVDKIVRKYATSDDQVYRTTFHPEYTYSDFTGQLLPVVKKNIITYDYQPGIFTIALRQAFRDLSKPIFLIIEEMSRGNVAAILGDIFQLLDRDDKGVSRYPVRNSVISKEILQFDDKDDLISLPANFYIIGTVNTSDQNVYVMDTAFKRRFDWKYISIDPVKNEDGSIFEDDNVKLELKVSANDSYVRWHDFYMKLNSFITDKNIGLGLGEDKQIGQFFIEFSKKMSEQDIRKRVENKLMQYLWEDVESASFETDTKLFDEQISNFSELHKALEENKQVFSEAFITYYNHD